MSRKPKTRAAFFLITSLVLTFLIVPADGASPEKFVPAPPLPNSAGRREWRAFVVVLLKVLRTPLTKAAEFQNDPLHSRPIGFYTWSAELEQVFVQDRWLQNLDAKLSFGAAVALPAAIESTPALVESNQRAISLFAGLTNPYASFPLTILFPYVDGFGSLEDVEGVRTRFKADHPEEPYFCNGVELAFLPASRSKETDFFLENYCDSAPASFMDALVDAIRRGALDLTPDPSASGWYDYQLHALETLLVPEKGAENDHLLLTAAYKKKLVETFKSLVTRRARRT